MLPQTIPEGTNLGTYDVVSQYTNELGIKAIRYWVTKHPQTTNSCFFKQFVIRDIRLILENNSVYFNKRHYLKIYIRNGNGYKSCTTYTTVAVDFIEETELYPKLEEQFAIENSLDIKEN